VAEQRISISELRMRAARQLHELQATVYMLSDALDAAVNEINKMQKKIEDKEDKAEMAQLKAEMLSEEEAKPV